MSEYNYKNLLLEKTSENFLLITINRPKSLNALSFELLTELDAILDNISKINNKTKGIIITGSEKSFCAGADIEQLAELDTTTGYKFAKFGQSVFSKLEQLPIPSIAAVNGYAFGGGCELAMSASIRIAAAKAQFGQPEVKLGVIPGYGGTQRLARLVGKGRALDLCLSGRFIDAQTALNWGLVNDVVDNTDNNLLDHTKKYLSTITNMAPLAIASVISSINYGFDLSLADALELESLHFAKTCGSNDKNIGVKAFLSKQKAEFNGN
ncbi:MAG: enoyl-CoA hydratase/isomerase family protein [Gammaproteobacteria bacterium]|nr:enoyl-CoA hydratase/isomerase family protein [Gammaproteobacteria bacterium]